MSDGPTFRAVGEAEVDRLLELIREAHAHERIAWAPEAVRAATLGLIADERRGGVWFIELESAIVGYVAITTGWSLEFHGQDAFVDELFLTEAARGRGLGTRAFEFAERTCRERGIAALHLEVDRENDGARRLYRRLGYREHDRTTMTKWL